MFSNRTLASGNLQKEANNINMSLMQLWRCLYAVKKKNDSTEMVPFRESKLTHILMPTLYRVGTSGTAMIACINPQNADYDESISILGNASLACEINIKEIPVEKATKNPTLRKISSRASNCSHDSTSTASISQPTKETRKRKASTVTASDNATESVKGMNDEIKVLQEEVKSLRERNEVLIASQLQREQEIREEVSGEMAKYCQGLLDQIRDLQDEIFELKTCTVDVRKSVKKAKREQRSLEHEESIRNLADSEEEMERQKKYYEGEIKALKQEIREAKIEIADWKVQATENNNSIPMSLKRKPLGTISPNVSPTQDSSELIVKKDKRSTSPYRETDGSGHPGIAPPSTSKMVGNGPFYNTRTLRSTTVRI